jgi:hypothetical protein
MHGNSHKLPGDLLVQNLAHRQRHDDAAGLLEEAANFAEGVVAVAEGERRSPWCAPRGS